MKLLNLNKIILIILCVFYICLPVFAQDDNTDNAPDTNVQYVSGKILEIISEKNNKTLEDSFHTSQVVQTAKVHVLNGKFKGKTVKIENQLTSNPVYDIKIKKGERVLLGVEESTGKTEFYIADLDRVPVLMIITGIFLSLLLIIGGMQGLRSIVSIAVTALLIFFALVPAVLNNFPVILTTVTIAIISTCVTMFTVGGINKKSLSATLGTVISVFISGVLSSLAIKYAPLNGFNTQEASMLWANRPNLDYTGILTAGVIIASLGAVMDVGISIASSIFEFKKVNNKLKIKDLFKSGLNVGKDIMGAMSNTLILAYIGSAFSLVLLASNAPLLKLLNLNSIAVEITSALTGSIGIVLCVPITAIISAYLSGQDNAKSSSDSHQNTSEKETPIKI